MGVLLEVDGDRDLGPLLRELSAAALLTRDVSVRPDKGTVGKITVSITNRRK